MIETEKAIPLLYGELRDGFFLILTIRESIILSLHLEIALGMAAYGTHFRSFLADDDMTTVTALPDGVTFT